MTAADSLGDQKVANKVFIQYFSQTYDKKKNLRFFVFK